MKCESSSSAHVLEKLGDLLVVLLLLRFLVGENGLQELLVLVAEFLNVADFVLKFSPLFAGELLLNTESCLVELW